ncbi:hypothetical protein PG990_004263 [Apiospora arundinis]
MENPKIIAEKPDLSVERMALISSCDNPCANRPPRSLRGIPENEWLITCGEILARIICTIIWSQ